MILIFTHQNDAASLRLSNLLTNRCLAHKFIHTILLKDIPNFRLVLEFGTLKLFVDNERVQTIYFRKFPRYNFTQIKNKFIENFIRSEIKSLLDFFISSKITDLRILGTSQRSTSEINKLKYIYLAPKFKIRTPKTIISTCLDDINEVLTSGIKYVIKPIHSVEFYSTRSNKFYMYTSILEKSILKNKSQLFFPTLLQEFIDKDCEIRTFYILNQFYSYASFGPSYSFESEVNIDSRDYHNRNDSIVNFNLPKVFEKKLIKLLKYLNINTASLDIMLSKQNTFFLLDINPYGIYDTASEYCNYPIESKILKFFTNES